MAYAAALRIARFPTTNEFGDWDTALHTFTFSNAVYQGLRRIPSGELLRGVFDAAMSVHLDRFLNVPPARVPEPDGSGVVPEELLAELPVLLDERQRVDEAGKMVAGYLYSGGEPDRLLAVMGGLLLGRTATSIPYRPSRLPLCSMAICVGPRSARTFGGGGALPGGPLSYDAFPGQTYDIARRLSRGEILYEE